MLAPDTNHGAKQSDTKGSLALETQLILPPFATRVCQQTRLAPDLMLPEIASKDWALQKLFGYFDMDGLYNDGSKLDRKNAITIASQALNQLGADVVKEVFVVHGSAKQYSLGSFNSITRAESIDLACNDVEVAAVLGVPLIMHGVVRYKNFLDSFARVYEYASSKNVKIWLETLPDWGVDYKSKFAIGATINDFIAIIDRAPEVGILLDVSHSIINDNDPSEFLRTFDRRVKAISLSNNDGGSDSHSSLTSPGVLKLNEVLATMSDLSWSGSVIFETIATGSRGVPPQLSPLHLELEELLRVWKNVKSEGGSRAYFT
jgi:sugar phosphate isomerase/epimerase